MWPEPANRSLVRRSRVETEFLPATLEILEQPASPTARVTMLTLMALLLLCLIWMAIGQLDIVAIAPGKVILQGQSKTVQPLVGGIVSAIRVDNGQHVQRGQVLIELDPTQAAGDLEKARSARIEAALTVARASALLYAAEHATPPRVATPVDADSERTRATQQLADQLYGAWQSKLNVQVAELHKREHELESTRFKVAALRQSVPLAARLASDYATLQAQHYISQHAYLEKELARIGQAQELASQQSYAQELADLIGEQRHAIAYTQADFRHTQADAADIARQQLVQLTIAEQQALQRNEQSTLRSPVTGTVQQLAVHTVGGVVTPAQTLLVVVPEAGGVEVEAQLLNQDIGFVHPGQEVQLKFNAFPYTEYGTIPARLVSISRDAVQDDKLGLVFPVRIRLRQPTITVHGVPQALSAGMECSAEIKLARRTILDTLLAPVRQYQQEALREH